MPSCRLGAHTFIFQQYGFDPVTQLEKMLSAIADSGFGSVELTNSSLGSDGFKSQVQSSLNSTGLEMIGASHGMHLWNLSEYERNYDILDEYSDRLSALGENIKCGMSCSGKDFSKRSEAENEHLIQAWIEVSEMFRSKDLELNYHNHGESQTDIAFVLDNVPEDILLIIFISLRKNGSQFSLKIICIMSAKKVQEVKDCIWRLFQWLQDVP